MGRQVINQIECAKCHKMFDVATEDIEWEHLSDAGETEEDNTIHDFNVFQTVDCHCVQQRVNAVRNMLPFGLSLTISCV